MKLNLEQNEYWWGGRVADGAAYPLKNMSYEMDFSEVRGENQLQPLFLSSAGRWIWSDEPFSFSLKDGVIEVRGRGEIFTGREGSSLKEVSLVCGNRFFPPSGTIPDPDLFIMPQYNTWIELMYDQNEEAILVYAENLLKEGYPPGVLMIDDTWQEDYGVWNFHPARFRDPAGMISQLHKWGFKVMLWVCPFVSADSVEYRYLAEKGWLIMLDGENRSLWSNTTNLPAVIRWWNGASGLLDLTHPEAEGWFRAKLDRLQKEYGADGFKFDAGDSHFYRGDFKTFREVIPEEHSALYAGIGLSYRLNEYRACWKQGGQPLAQRLRDKHHSWEDLVTLIPETLIQGLTGYPFSCPDMIGGGEYLSFLNLKQIDQELVVRSAQCSALLPMMQFSAAPWRILDGKHKALCLDAARLHASKGELFLHLAEEASQTGKPIVRSLEYSFPNEGFAEVKDQFLIGEELLVVPVLKKGERKRYVVFPPGKWKDVNGIVRTGPDRLELEAPLEKLLWFQYIR